MKRRSAVYTTVFTLILVFALSATLRAQQVVTVEAAKPAAPPLPLADLLPATLTGVSAAGDIKQVGVANLAELVADQAVIFQEYDVTGAASRLYGGAQITVFETAKPFAAFGLFSYHVGSGANQQAKGRVIGSGSAALADAFVFWKSGYFVKIANVSGKRTAPANYAALAAAIAAKIPENNRDAERPTLLGSLPQDSLVTGSERYVLGGAALGTSVAGAGEWFPFDGEAEAVVADYQPGATQTAATAKTRAASLPAVAPITLMIVEYHTPQFATQAMVQVESRIAALSEEERARVIVQRVGNFLVAATGVTEREFARQLIAKIEYPYVVKWLQNPAIPTDDPFRVQKAATMLVSTITIIGLTGLIVLAGGSLVGTFIFMRRRKQQRAVFSDAGGMLRLQLDPVEEAMLRLPPAKE